MSSEQELAATKSDPRRQRATKSLSLQVVKVIQTSHLADDLTAIIQQILVL